MKFITGALTCPACDGTRNQVNFGKRGTATITCQGDDCGAQTFVKSPAGVLTLRARLNVLPPGWKLDNENATSLHRGGSGRSRARAPALAVVAQGR